MARAFSRPSIQNKRGLNAVSLVLISPGETFAPPVVAGVAKAIGRVASEC